MTTTYKGYPLSTKTDTNAHPDYSYIAYIDDVPNGREHVRANSSTKALEMLKHKIDNFTSFNTIHFRPLSENDQAKLVSYIKDHDFEIRRKLRSKHYIVPGDFYLINDVAIYNHYDLIRDTLNLSHDLDIAYLGNPQTGCIDKVLLYDATYFSTPSKMEVLESILHNL